MLLQEQLPLRDPEDRFQWAPTLGGECYATSCGGRSTFGTVFQWAPTLGGECYESVHRVFTELLLGFNGHPPLGVNATGSRGAQDAPKERFQWAPTLGGECYAVDLFDLERLILFQWAPTLGGECYTRIRKPNISKLITQFQWAPTLGGECYVRCPTTAQSGDTVSMGTHPWG